MSDNYYTILGLPKNATTQQIRGRFLQLARERHPDRFSDEEKDQAEEEFQKITQAYNALHDPRQRSKYDQEIEMRGRAGGGEVTAEAARVYVRRGVEAFKKQNYQEAVSNFERATTENPADAQAWYYLAKAYRQRAAWLSRGVAAAAKACELDGMNADYLKLAGELAAETGMTARAIKYYRDALTFGGDDPAVKSELSRLRKQRK
jgi:DnaJ-class molecular chaperone